MGFAMIRRHMTTLRLGLLAVDALSALGLFVVVSLWRFGPAAPEVWRDLGVDPVVLAAVWAVVWVTVLWLLDLYRLRSRWSVKSEVRDVLAAGMLIAVASFSALFLVKLPDVSRLFLLVLFVSQTMVTLGLRLGLRFGLRALRDHGFNTRSMLVVGTGPEARRWADRVERHRELGLRISGHVAMDDDDLAASGGVVGGRPIIGTIGQLEAILHDRVVDEVAICLPPEHLARIEPITRLCEEVGKIVRIPIGELGLTLPGGRLEDFDGIPILSLVYGPDRAISFAIKRVLDIGLASAGLLLLSPLFAVIAAWIVLMDGRPVLFRQVRVGLHGRPFQVAKFRTMANDAEARLAELATLNEIRGPAFKLTHDPRLTRTGRFLRATSLDELPQLWNVLRGEMSIVGPRPPLPAEVAGYDLWHRRRLSMKPGITGLWQVEARREEDFDRWVELDLAYIDRWSVWLDLKIMVRTIPAMLQGR
jgi:exopolysaccharide biosynthesis polyprenyl glycosylphosphotransferase